MKLFRAISVVLLLGLAVWILIGLWAPVGQHPQPEVLGLGSAFEGNLQLPQATIQSAFNLARDKMFAVNQKGSRLRLGGDLAGWLSFAATSTITLILGFFGRAPPAQNAPADTAGLPASTARVVGLLAALAAILTAAAGIAITRSSDYFKRADEIRALIVQSQQQVIDARTSRDAQAVLDELRLQTQR